MLSETKFELHSFCFILFFDKASCGSEKTDKSFFSLTLLVFSLSLHYLLIRQAVPWKYKIE